MCGYRSALCTAKFSISLAIYPASFIWKQGDKSEKQRMVFLEKWIVNPQIFDLEGFSPCRLNSVFH